MTIVVACDEGYFKKASSLWKSLRKNWRGRVCVLCVGFKAFDEFDYGFEIASCNIEDFKCYNKDWPNNRSVYFCSESGEFLKYFNFDDDEIIVHLDADMILQRPLSDEEDSDLNWIEQGEIAMSPSSYPPTTLREELFKLKPKRTYTAINEMFPGVLGEMNLLCCGMIVARAKTYKAFSKIYLNHLDKMVQCFDHHAASQWLFNYLLEENILTFTKYRLNGTYHNASWFIDTLTSEQDNQLIYDKDRVVLFNHTKFNKEYKF